MPLQRFSIGFKSGDCAGHSKTFTLLFSNQERAFLLVCLGSLSSWKSIGRSPFSCGQLRNWFANLIRLNFEPIIYCHVNEI